jgi:flagellar biosynthetic protein FliR
VNRRDDIVQFILRATGALFQQALVLSMPVLGTLFIVSVAMGLLSKAAPQMNLLTEGFPVSLAVTFFIMLSSLPFMMEAFSHLVDASFDDLGILVGGKL